MATDETSETSAAPAESAASSAPASGSKIELPGTDAPLLEATEIEAPKADEIKPSPRPAGRSFEPSFGAMVPFTSQPAPGIRLTLLAATVTIAAAVGALVGAIGATGLAHYASADVAAPVTPDPKTAVIGQLRSELAAIKTSIEANNRSSSAFFSKTADRLDKIDHAQADPAAKLAKVSDAIERMERHSDAAKDTTASIPTPPPTLASAPTQSAPSGPQPNVPGWTVRGVYGGLALLQGRMGLIEVAAGDVVPGIGRIDSIHKQDGRWMVVTSKGVIVSTPR